MTKYTSRAKATIFVVARPRVCKLTDGTAEDGTQSESNSKRKDTYFQGITHGDLSLYLYHEQGFVSNAKAESATDIIQKMGLLAITKAEPKKRGRMPKSKSV